MAIKITNRLQYYYIDSSKSHVGGMYLTKQELKSLHTKIGKILNIPDWQKEMEEDKKKFIN